MPTLFIPQGKPNPLGRDRLPGGFTPLEQLAAEWMDITNLSGQNVSLLGIELLNKAYPINSNYPQWKRVIQLSGYLGPWQTLRVHSGKACPLRVEDQLGANVHVFTENLQYVWNNDKPDSARLIKMEPSGIQTLDLASYSAHPPEKILKRFRDMLI